MSGKKQKKKNRVIWTGILVATVALIGLTAFVFQAIRCEAAAAGKLEAEKERIRQEKQVLIDRADLLEKGYFYQEALDVLNARTDLIDKEVSNDAITLKIEEIQKSVDSLVKYEGPVEHIFFHSLIVYPALAFDSIGSDGNGYNMWMTTVKEFEQILPQLEEKGYILIPLDQIAENPEGNGGEIKLRDLYLPPGKKPLVMSFDDVNYYDYMKGDGFADKLVLGDDGRVWTQVTTPQGKVVQTRDGDAMPILDDYVEAHPEFSWRGAKGTLAITGFQGALGYRITDDLPNTAEMQQEVKAISSVMKKNGWLFACHSHTHWRAFSTREITMDQMKWDLDQWKTKIEPWVGETNIYISPFGYRLDNDDPRYRQIISSGFTIFCPVGNERKITVYPDNIVMPRVNIDGFSMVVRKQELIQYYFDVDAVYEKSRPILVQ